jgi:hypothetical protein
MSLPRTLAYIFIFPRKRARKLMADVQMYPTVDRAMSCTKIYIFRHVTPEEPADVCSAFQNICTYYQCSRHIPEYEHS